MEKQLFVGLTTHLHGSKQHFEYACSQPVWEPDAAGFPDLTFTLVYQLTVCTALTSVIHQHDKQWRATASSLNATRLCPSDCGLVTVDSNKSRYSCLGMRSLVCFIGDLTVPVRSLFFLLFKPRIIYLTRRCADQPQH